MGAKNIFTTCFNVNTYYANELSSFLCFCFLYMYIFYLTYGQYMFNIV